MRRSARVVVCLCIALPLAAAEPQDPPPAPTIEHTIEVADTGLESLQRQIWQGHDLSQTSQPDAVGRRIADDLDEYVMTESARAHIEALRATLPEAVPEGSKIVASSAWDPFDKALTAEYCKITLISVYWIIHNASQFHRGLIEPVIEALPADQADQARKRLAAVAMDDQQVRERIFPRLNRCPDISGLDESLGDITPASVSRPFNELRAALIGQLQDPTLGKAAWKDRSGDCGPSAQKTSGKRTPAYAVLPDISKFYPPEARAFQVEGVVRVMIAIDAQGCVKAVALAQSSGSDQLDDAGLDAAQQMSFLPAEQDGKAVDSTVAVPIRFSLRDN